MAPLPLGGYWIMSKIMHVAEAVKEMPQKSPPLPEMTYRHSSQKDERPRRYACGLLFSGRHEGI
jgi:hypothetical protein